MLLVAHGTLIRFLLSGVIERPLDSIPNATLSLIELEGTTWRVRMIAGREVDHAVEVPSRAQNPRFVVDKAQLTPGAHITGADDHAAASATIPGGNA